MKLAPSQRQEPLCQWHRVTSKKTRILKQAALLRTRLEDFSGKLSISFCTLGNISEERFMRQGSTNYTNFAVKKEMSQNYCRGGKDKLSQFPAVRKLLLAPLSMCRCIGWFRPPANTFQENQNDPSLHAQFPPGKHCRGIKDSVYELWYVCYPAETFHQLRSPESRKGNDVGPRQEHNTLRRSGRNDMTFLKLPTHTTHTLQTLDGKLLWSRTRKVVNTRTRRKCNLNNVPELLETACGKATTANPFPEIRETLFLPVDRCVLTDCDSSRSEALTGPEHTVEEEIMQDYHALLKTTKG